MGVKADLRRCGGGGGVVGGDKRGAGLKTQYNRREEIVGGGVLEKVKKRTQVPCKAQERKGPGQPWKKGKNLSQVWFPSKKKGKTTKKEENAQETLMKWENTSKEKKRNSTSNKKKEVFPDQKRPRRSLSFQPGFPQFQQNEARKQNETGKNLRTNSGE